MVFSLIFPQVVPICKDPHKASSVFISPIKEKTLCDREFQGDVQKSSAEESNAVEGIEGRGVINDMSR